MKDWIINLAGKAAGVGKLLDVVDGWKTYIAGASLVLLGAGQLLGEVAALDLHSLAAVIAFAKQVPTDPATLELLNGLGVIGLRHAVSKSA